jgi:hypothetical protein
MASCKEIYGKDWEGEFPDCVYSPSELLPGQSPAGTYAGDTPFTGTIESLGYGKELAGSTWEDDWQKFFDPYDPEEEEMLTKAAGIDIRQLGTAWGLKSKGLGKAWGTKIGELRGGADVSSRAANVAYSGTIETGLKKGLKAGESIYEQAMEVGELGLQQATTDIYQGLETDVFGARKDWEKGQRTTLNILLGGGIWPGDTEEDSNWATAYEPFVENIVPADNEELARKSTCEARGGTWHQNRCDMNYGGG